MYREIGLTAVFALVLAAVGCSSSDPDATSVAVTGSDSSCDIAQAELPAGPIDFEFTNKAGDVNELYVLRENGEIVSEVENVTTGTSRTLSVDLVAGNYKVNCKPGQTGDGFKSSFEVTGKGGRVEATPDRTVTFDAYDFGYKDLDLDVHTGETIRFEMTNIASDQPHEFEVLKPNGDPLGEIGAVEPAKKGGVTLTFTEAGKYTYQCILVDPATKKTHAMLGMTGTFTVTQS